MFARNEKRLVGVEKMITQTKQDRMFEHETETFTFVEYLLQKKMNELKQDEKNATINIQSAEVALRNIRRKAIKYGDFDQSVNSKNLPSL
jgi:hypothetical protein